MAKTPILSDQDVENLIDCAGDGIGYWATSGAVDADAKTYHVIEADLESPASDTGEKTLTFDEIREAFVLLASKDLLPAFQMREIEEDDLCFDATVGDMTIQQAMFGELVFG